LYLDKKTNKYYIYSAEFKGISHVTRALCRISNIDSYNTDPAKASEVNINKTKIFINKYINEIGN